MAYFSCEAKEVEDLLNLFKCLSKHGIPLCTSLASAPLFQVAVIVNTLQPELGQLPATAESCHQVVEDVEVLLPPAVRTEKHEKTIYIEWEVEEIYYMHNARVQIGK